MRLKKEKDPTENDLKKKTWKICKEQGVWLEFFEEAWVSFQQYAKRMHTDFPWLFIMDHVEYTFWVGDYVVDLKTRHKIAKVLEDTNNGIVVQMRGVYRVKKVENGVLFSSCGKEDLVTFEGCNEFWERTERRLKKEGLI
jgi:hypothetical protein